MPETSLLKILFFTLAKVEYNLPKYYNQRLSLFLMFLRLYNYITKNQKISERLFYDYTKKIMLSSFSSYNLNPVEKKWHKPKVLGKLKL